MQRKLVRPIIVNYNGHLDTIECLAALRAQEGVECCPLVVDNASADESVREIRAAFPDVEMLVNSSNLGFGGGNNIGIRHALAAGCDYVFLVNNDTTMEADCLSQLISAAESRPEAAVVAPAIYWYADRSRPWFTGSQADMVHCITAHAVNDVRCEGLDQPFEIPWSTGCAMLIGTPQMRRIGGFDERYFCYYEDLDWSFRARKIGYQCELCPTALLYHKVSATSGLQSLRSDYYGLRNRLLFFVSHAPARLRPMITLKLSVRTLREARFELTYGRPDAARRRARVRTTALADFHRRRFGKCRHDWINNDRASETT